MKKCPTLEEFRSAVRQDLYITFPNCTEEEIEKMLQSEDGQMYIEAEYAHNIFLFDTGKITRKQFLTGGVNAVSYNFYVTF